VSANRVDLREDARSARDLESGFGMTIQEIRDEVVIIFIAGHETTAVAMTFVWYLLSKHPLVEAKLHQELAAVLNGRPPKYEDLERLPYTRQVIQEAMRLYPPVPGLAGRHASANFRESSLEGSFSESPTTHPEQRLAAAVEQYS
jgi:cytochrome P450